MLCLLLAVAASAPGPRYTYHRAYNPFPGVGGVRTNFSGACGAVLGGAPGTARDVVVYGFDMKASFSDEKQARYAGQVRVALGLLRRSVPRATAVVFAIYPVGPELRRIYEEANVTIIPIPQFVGWQTANARILATYQFLLEHKDSIDRVVFADLRDVLFFNDPFRLITNDSIIMAQECFQTEQCIVLNHHPMHFQWFAQSFGVMEAYRFKEMEVPLINSGIIMGRAEPMRALFRELDKHIKPKHKNLWGYEQSLLNLVVYSGFMDTHHIALHECDQTVCITQNGIDFGKKTDQVVLVSNGCSPVVMHQGIPLSWGFNRE